MENIKNDQKRSITSSVEELPDSREKDFREMENWEKRVFNAA